MLSIFNIITYTMQPVTPSAVQSGLLDYFREIVIILTPLVATLYSLLMEFNNLF